MSLLGRRLGNETELVSSGLGSVLLCRPVAINNIIMLSVAAAWAAFGHFISIVLGHTDKKTVV
jgi:hypothetical protein